MSESKRITDLEELAGVLRDEGSPHADLVEACAKGWREDICDLLEAQTILDVMPQVEHRTGFTNITDEWNEWDHHRDWYLRQIKREGRE